MEMEKEKEVVYKKGLTLRAWVLIFITIIVQISTTQINHTMTNVWMFPNGIFALAPTLIILFFHNILPERWKLNKQELTLLILISFFNANGFYIVGGYISPYGGAQLLPASGIVSSAYIKSISPYKESFSAFFPDWLGPSNNLDAIITGGVLDWAVWMPAIFFWSLIWIVYILFGTMLSFSLRKPLVETERLMFPMAMCTYPLLDYQIEKDGGKRVKLLNFSRPEAKAFWIGGLVGIIMGSSDVLSYFLPNVPPSWEYAGNHVDMSGVFQQFLPGAYGNTWLWWMDVPIYCFCSLDITLTAVVFNIFFFIIYPAMAVRIGWVSYVPGVETYSDSQYGYAEGPFKFMYWGTYGLMFGLGVWMVWNYRKHFVSILQNAFGQATGPKEEEGISYRFVGLGMIGLWVLMLILWIVVGIPPITAFMGLILLVLYLLASTRVRADTYIDDAPLIGVRGYLYDIGYATGSWGSAPYVNGALFQTMYVPAVLTGIEWTGFSPSMQLQNWKIAYETKTDPKDVMKMILVATIFSVVFANVFGLWWWSKVGGITTSPGYTTYSDRAADSQLYTLNTGHTLSSLERVWYAATGTIFVFLCFFLRARFPWFFIHPAGVWTAVATSCCHLWAPIIGLVYKFVIMKIGGTKLWERVGVPGVAGFITTQTLGMFFVLAWYGFFTQAVPAAMAHF